MAEAFRAERKRLNNPRTLLLGHDNHVARSNEQYHPIGARLSEDLTYANLSVDGFQVETRMGDQFDPPSPEPARRTSAMGDDQRTRGADTPPGRAS